LDNTVPRGVVVERIEHKSDVIEIKNFLTKEECKNLIDYFEGYSQGWQMTCFFNARVMDPLAPYEAGTATEVSDSYIKNLRTKLKVEAEKVFSRELRNLSLSSHKWLTGAFADFHSDNTELDGTPNAWRENKLVTIVYLNDDYQGGNLVFRDHDIDIAPEGGTVVVFDVGYQNIHGVTEVTGGTRWTMLASFDYADSEYPAEYWEEKERELEETKLYYESQHSEWEALISNSVSEIKE
jgi:hypothetical protein